MSTNVTKTDKSPIPAGLITGIEAFWYENEKMVIANGTVSRYENSHPEVQKLVLEAFNNDTESLAYLSRIGINRFPDTFDRWFKCVVGGLDHVPDIMSKKFTPDSYNNLCNDTSCKHRGKLCSRSAGLKNFEIETIVALKQGVSIESAALILYVSIPTIKSRLEKIKQKLQVPNMAALMVKTTELGI
jgi:DNA-binding CsgD family transcriptional regulator